MKKIKGIFLLLIGVVLGVFLYENWVAAPYFRFFGRDLVQLTISVIMIIFFSLGFITGALSFLAWAHRRQKNSQAALQQQEAPETQETADQENDEEKQRLEERR